MVPNDHLRKDWYKRVKYYFNDAAKAQRRRINRAKLAKHVAPRPIETLRPLVHCPTVRYNRKIRLGRGFTKEELVAAGVDPARARFMGIAVDERRSHIKDAGLKQQNVDRIKAYVSRLVRVKKGETLPEGVSAPELFAVPKKTVEVELRTIDAAAKEKSVFKEKHQAYLKWRADIKAKKLEKFKK